MSSYRVAIDIGGTFTDFVFSDRARQRVLASKVATTPQNFALGVLEGLRGLIPNPRDIEFLVHGTTVGINTFLERKGVRVLLITTAGFRDSYVVARGDRRELYAIQYHKPARLVPRRDIHEVRERITWDGSVLDELHIEDFEPIIEKIRREKIVSVTVCFLHSYINPGHELAAEKILKDAIPNLSITLSHRITREWREYERASTSVMNAYIAPAVEKYLATLGEEMKAMKIPSTLHVMQSNGGVISSSSAMAMPIKTLMSGPVGGTIGGKALSKIFGRSNLICTDMGGTSFDVSMIIDGEPIVRSTTELEGIPLLLPVIDIHTIGAGGGSIAWLDGGALRVGPQSAGADPGPACYGRGGSAPTITDANLFLKRINPNYFLGGRMILDEECAASALTKVANELGIGPAALAEGMIDIVNSKMANAIRTITIEHGIDPRDFSLVAYGGAGPMHAVWLARELDIPEVVVPWHPGAFSAWGMLQTDIREDLVTSFYQGLANTEIDLVQSEFHRLEEEGEELLRDEGVKPSEMSFLWFADMRYVGQEHSVLVSLDQGFNLDQMAEAFHKTHHMKYSHSSPGSPVEFVNLRVAAYGALVREDARSILTFQEGKDPITGYRDVVFDGIPVKTKILDRACLSPGQVFQSPLVMEEPTATTIAPPGYKLTIDMIGNAVIAKEEQT